MSRGPTPGRRLSFEAVLENWAEGMDYCAVPVPAEITQALGTKGPVLVMARVNDSDPFQVSLFPVGGGQHYIRIRKRGEARLDRCAPAGTNSPKHQEVAASALKNSSASFSMS